MSAGHADLSTTQRYMHRSPATTEDAIRLLDGRYSDHGPANRLRQDYGGQEADTTAPKTPIARKNVETLDIQQGGSKDYDQRTSESE
jgi:hypothetical protein